MRGVRLLWFFVSFCLPLASSHGAIFFTGLTTEDFPSQACFADPGGNDIGIPNSFPATQRSGFDFQSVCFSYDPALDTLYVGIQTFNDVGGHPVIFGDADGDGDSGAASPTLEQLGGKDFADLGGTEFVTLAIDFDGDEAPDLVVGVNTGNDISGFAAVGGAAAPNNAQLFAPFPQFYGAPLVGVLAAVYASTSNAAPHLEFSVTGLSDVTEFASLDLNDPDAFVRLYLTTGSFADAGISEDYFPSQHDYLELKVDRFLDSDGDGIPDAFDPPDPDPVPEPPPPPAPPAPVPVANPGGGGTGFSGDHLEGGGIGCQMMSGATPFGMGFWWLFLVVAIGIVPRVWGLNADLYRQDSDGLGFPNIESAQTLRRGEFSAGLLQHIVHSPLKLGQRGTAVSETVVNYFYVWDLWGAFGLLDTLDAGINFPVSLLTQIKDIGAVSDRNASSVGDIRLQGKWRFLEPEQNVLRTRLALLAFVDFPSGNTNDFFGEGSVAGGVKAVGERHFGRHELMLNLGAYARRAENVVVSGTPLIATGPAMLWGAGWRWPFSAGGHWSLRSGFWGSTDFGGGNTSPAEWDAAMAKRFAKETMEASLGFGMGLGEGYGAPVYRILLGMSYFPGRREVKAGLPSPGGVGVKEPQARLEGREIIVLRPVHFETNKAVIRPVSYPILNDVANLLRQNQTLLRVRIDGHTDSAGSDAFNLSLSLERAEAVRRYLEGKEIAPRRLTVKGWGERQPVASNVTAEGRARNRRVEFHVIEAER